MSDKTDTESIRKLKKELVMRNESDRHHYDKMVKEQEGKGIPQSIIDECLTRPTITAFIFKGSDNEKPLEKGFVIDEDTPLDMYRKLLHWNNPEATLIMSINLTRTREDILFEVNRFLDLYHEPSKVRFRPDKIREYLKVWDIWESLDVSGKKAFPIIAKKLNISPSTVKTRWYKAYKYIYGKKFDHRDFAENSVAQCASCMDWEKGCNEKPCSRIIKRTGRKYLDELNGKDYSKIKDSDKYLSGIADNDVRIPTKNWVKQKKKALVCKECNTIFEQEITGKIQCSFCHKVISA
jgi:hypothetical protein